MCLVEVEKSRKPLPACATPVTDGMKVFTRSKIALDAQKAVMEFLLINHPLDCPICDQGGECELQDVSMGYGSGISRYTEEKRVVDDENLGSLIATDMTRCIHCTRCVRFGEEVAGVRELGLTGRGENTRIATYVAHAMTSEVSGNVIDLCPVGALTNKPFRYKARTWEMQQAASIAPHDCLGSNLYLHTRKGQVMRSVPKEEQAINKSWLSDRDRFSHFGAEAAERLQEPMIKRNGQWQSCDWQTAMQFAAEKLAHSAKQSAGLAGLISPTATTEEAYLTQKLLRAIGSHSIDHRLQQRDFSDQNHAPLYYGSEKPYAELELQECIFIIGSDIHREVPLAGLRVRKAVLNDGKALLLNPQRFNTNFDATHLDASSASLVSRLAEVAKALAINLPAVANVTISNESQQFAEHLKSANAPCILLGLAAYQHPHAATIRALAEAIAKATSGWVMQLTPGANSAGASIAGALPHRGPGGKACENVGDNAWQMFAEQKAGYLLVNVAPELDCAQSASLQALTSAEAVVCLTPFFSATMQEYADVLLPICPYTETSGTFINLDGLWQSFAGAAKPIGESRPAWKVLRVLGNLLEIDGFDYTSSSEVIDELKAQLQQASASNQTAFEPKAVAAADDQLRATSGWPLYQADSLLRHAKPLQDSAANKPCALYLNQQMADRFSLQSGQSAVVEQDQQQLELTVSIDNTVADNEVFIPAGFAESAKLLDRFGAITIRSR